MGRHKLPTSILRKRVVYYLTDSEKIKIDNKIKELKERNE